MKKLNEIKKYRKEKMEKSISKNSSLTVSPAKKQ
jgi:hypothetical protein